MTHFSKVAIGETTPLQKIVIGGGAQRYPTVIVYGEVIHLKPTLIDEGVLLQPTVIGFW